MRPTDNHKTEADHEVKIWQPQRGSLLRLLERLALWVERPINWLVGAPQLNPFYHTGTIAVFLWLLVAFTGVYLMFFYQFGFKESYLIVAEMESQLVAHVIRAIHRYASGAAMIVSILHGIRLLFMDRFRGPRWLAWVTGVVMVVVLWVDGVTGYWLIWDQRAQLITSSFTAWLDRWTPWAALFLAGLLSAGKKDQSWIFIGIVFGLHVLLSGLVALFFWWHIIRLNRPKFLPARHWLIGLGAVVVLLSAAFPLGMLPMANFDRLPGPVTLDPIYLFYLPAELRNLGGWLWGALGALLVVSGVLPWLARWHQAPPPVHIDQARCIGCTQCAADCPYKAISMLPRTDGTLRGHKYVASANLDLCVSCGVCVGSCSVQGISLGTLSQQALWNIVEGRLSLAKSRAPQGQVKVIFTCARHAQQGARPYLNPATRRDSDVVIPLPCVASAPPNLVARTLDSGAAKVLVVGCPPDDCAQREGNLWTEERLTRKRLPRLKRAYANAPIATAWLAPDAFPKAPRAPQNPMFPKLGWRNFIPAFVLMGILFALQVRLTTWPFQPYPTDQAHVQVVLDNPSKSYAVRTGQLTVKAGLEPVRLVFEADGQLLVEQPYVVKDLLAGRARPVFKDLPLTSGEHHLRLGFESGQTSLAVFDQTVHLRAGQILILDDRMNGGQQNTHLK